MRWKRCRPINRTKLRATGDGRKTAGCGNIEPFRSLGVTANNQNANFPKFFEFAIEFAMN